MADSKISTLAAITSLADADELAVASGGASKKITGGNLRTSLLTQSEATLSGDVTLVSANTFVDGPSLSLAAATWLCLWKAMVAPITSTSQSYWWMARLWNGATYYDEAEFTVPAAANYNGWSFPLSGFAVVTLASLTTVKLSIACGKGSSASVISRDTIDQSGASHTATKLTAIRIG